MKRELETYAFDATTETFKVEGSDGRTVTALAVPFDALPNDGRRIAFLPGSFKNTINGSRQTAVPFYGLHPSPMADELPVGHSIELTETAAGLIAKFRISNTPRGNDVLELIKDGTLPGVSVGVVPLRHRKAGGRIEFQEVKLAHVAGVPDPAFNSPVLSVHSSQHDGERMSLSQAQARLTVITNKFTEAQRITR